MTTETSKSIKTAQEWANDLSQPDNNTQMALSNLENDEAKVIIIGKRKFKIRGMRAKAQSLITKMMLTRKVVTTESDQKEVILAMQKYSNLPYKVAAAGLLNNWAFLIWMPFIHTFYTWYLRLILDQKEVLRIVDACVESLNSTAFFLSIIKIESAMDTMMTMTKKEVGVLYQEIQSAQKSI